MATDSFADAVASCRYLRNNVQWTTGRKRMIGIMAAIRTAMHMQTADNLFGTRIEVLA